MEKFVSSPRPLWWYCRCAWKGKALCLFGGFSSLDWQSFNFKIVVSWQNDHSTRTTCRCGIRFSAYGVHYFSDQWVLTRWRSRWQCLSCRLWPFLARLGRSTGSALCTHGECSFNRSTENMPAGSLLHISYFADVYEENPQVAHLRFWQLIDVFFRGSYDVVLWRCMRKRNI